VSPKCVLPNSWCVVICFLAAKNDYNKNLLPLSRIPFSFPIFMWKFQKSNFITNGMKIVEYFLISYLLCEIDIQILCVVSLFTFCHAFFLLILKWKSMWISAEWKSLMSHFPFNGKIDDFRKNSLRIFDNIPLNLDFMGFNVAIQSSGKSF
jgi:hypothetical protein